VAAWAHGDHDADGFRRPGLPAHGQRGESAADSALPHDPRRLVDGLERHLVG
jgi:hypothetical protein